MKKEQKIINFITLIVVLTISIQVYWNYVQYANNRILVINDIQTVLDKVSVDYTNRHTQKSTFTSVPIISQIGETKNNSLQKTVDRVLDDLRSNNQINIKNYSKTSISYSFFEDKTHLFELDQLIKAELKRKKYNLVYNLTVIKNGKITESIGQKLESFEIISARWQITPTESFYAIQLNYANPTIAILLNGLTGIILSFVLCCIVIFSLYYLLHINRKQKQLSEIKNDFISNVTHEFKTPIATVTSAIEAIKKYNNNPISDKTKRYLDISEQQLTKLNHLVEKVMETSLLENSELTICKKNTDIIKLIKDCVEKHQLTTQKSIQLEKMAEHYMIEIDEFHFDNAISNLIDNSIKYGGKKIEISIDVRNNVLIIAINDNGEGISKQDKPYVFDKFFRVKTQNIHTIKGFGIGLYYTKKIIEKHNGKIELSNQNTFIITLWI